MQPLHRRHRLLKSATDVSSNNLGDFADVDLTGAADNDLMYRSGGNWVDTGGLLRWDGSTLTADRKAAGVTAINVGPDDAALRGDTQDGALRLFGEHSSVVYGFQLSAVSSNLQIVGSTYGGATAGTQVQNYLNWAQLSGSTWTIWDSLNVDSLTISQNTTETTFAGSQNIKLQPGAAHEVYVYRNGDNVPFRVYDSTGVDRTELMHDGTQGLLDTNNGRLVLQGENSTYYATGTAADPQAEIVGDHMFVSTFGSATGWRVTHEAFLANSTDGWVTIARCNGGSGRGSARIYVSAVGGTAGPDSMIIDVVGSWSEESKDIKIHRVSEGTGVSRVRSGWDGTSAHIDIEPGPGTDASYEIVVVSHTFSGTGWEAYENFSPSPTSSYIVDLIDIDGTNYDVIWGSWDIDNSDAGLQHVRTGATSALLTPDRLYIGTDRLGYFQAVTGQYGSVEVVGVEGSAGGGWHGYSIGGRHVFMDSGSSETGIYDDNSNGWMFRAIDGAQSEMYYNGVASLKTVLRTAADEVSGANVLDGEGNFTPVGLGVSKETALSSTGTITPFTQARAGKCIYWTGGTATNMDTYGSTGSDQTNIPAGAWWFVQNNGAGALTFRGGTGVTVRYWDGAETAPPDADVSIARGGIATIRKVSDTVYDIWGHGLT